MKLIQHVLCLVFLNFLCLGSNTAQSISLPTISSQYLTQGNDLSAINLAIEYKDGKATWLIEGKSSDFTQQNLYQYLDARFAKLETEIAQQSNIKLDAPKDMPVQHLQDVYAWVQIYGNRSLHLAMYESSNPKEKQYLPLDVLPFTTLEAACTHYAASMRGSHTAIGAFAMIHPNTERLTTDKKTNLSLVSKSVRPDHYIPQNILTIDLNENNEVVFKGRQSNPEVLAPLIQTALLANYESSYEKADPKKFLWLNLKLAPKATYQQYAAVMVALQEAYHLYWEELSFIKFEKSYLELDVQQKWAIQQTCPKLIAQYNPIELLYIQEKLSGGEPKKWSDL